MPDGGSQGTHGFRAGFVLEAEAELLDSESLLSKQRGLVAIASLSPDLSLGRIQPDNRPNS